MLLHRIVIPAITALASVLAVPAAPRGAGPSTPPGRRRPGVRVRAAEPSDRRERMTGDRGQTTAEYALVLLGAAAIAALMIAWATRTGAIGKLFDAVLSNVLGRVR